MKKKEPKFIDMPGLQSTVIRFNSLLEASEKFDHVLIRGPRGVGKSYFLKIFKEYYQELHSDVIHLNCASIHPATAESELFGHVKGAYTDATTERKGYLKTAVKKGGVIILEELNSLSEEIQAKLLVFMELFFFYPLGSEKREVAQVRIISTMNFESDSKIREDVLDRFRVVLDVPPLHERRSDILAIIGKKFPELNISSLSILILFAHNWPGNIRQLEQALFEYKATGSFSPDVVNIEFQDSLYYVFKRFIDAGLADIDIARLFPIDLLDIIDCLIQPSWNFYRPPVPALGADGKKQKTSYDIPKFFQLIYGKRSIISKEHILTLEPFSRDSLADIKSEEERIKIISPILERSRKLSDAVSAGLLEKIPMETSDNYHEIMTSYREFLEKEEANVQGASETFLAVLSVCEEIGEQEEANREKPVADELTPNQVAKYLLDSPENFPDVCKNMLYQQTQRGIADILGISTTTVNKWKKAIHNNEWPPYKKSSK